MGTYKRHRQPLKVLSDINVTNLLDTAFILLIAFMLVKPQLTYELKISPPEVTDAPQVDQSIDKTLYVFIQPAAAEGESERVYVKVHSSAPEKRVTVDDVYSAVTRELVQRPDLNVVVESDKDASAGILVEVVNAVMRAGVDGMGISVKPKSNN